MTSYCISNNARSSFSSLVVITVLLILCTTTLTESSKQYNNKVKLTDVSTLTLYKGQMTTGRRSSPVNQLQCIYGGSVDCSEVYLPSVQCYNRGSNGIDVQWECKADLDTNWKFGHVQVTCEGYEYPDDPYVLAGSCGLEYYIDYVKGSQKQGQGGGGGWFSSSKPSSSSYYSTKPTTTEDSSKSWVVLIGVGILVYAIYKTCIAPGNARTPDGRSRSNDDFNDQDRRRPPPPGFRQDFFDSGTGGSDSCGGSYSRSTGAGLGGSGAGGFWTGAATGGLLGYMMGNRK